MLEFFQIKTENISLPSHFGVNYKKYWTLIEFLLFQSKFTTIVTFKLLHRVSPVFCFAVYFLSWENVFNFFLNRCISIRSVKSSVKSNTIRESFTVRVILSPPSRSQYDSLFFLTACFYTSIQLMT